MAVPPTGDFLREPEFRPEARHSTNGRSALAMDLDRYAEPTTNDSLDRVDQARGVVTFDPIPKERIRNANDE